MQKPFGFRPIKTAFNEPHNAIVDVILDSTNDDNVFVNDLVTSLNQTDDTGISFCRRTLPADVIRGIVIGFREDRTYENEIFRRAGTRRIVSINQNPAALCEAYINDAINTDDINKYLDIDDGAGNVVTGLSEMALDYATLSENSGQFKILKIIKIVDTETAKYSIVEGIISKHEFMRGSVLAHSYWDRVNNDLVPDNTGDNVSLLDAGRGIRFLDPLEPQDVVTLQFLIDYVNSIPLINAQTKVDVLPVTLNGQTVFTLSEAPVGEDAIVVTVNGQAYYRNNGGIIGFTLSGTELTWSTPNNVSLKTTDLFIAWYNFIAATPPPPLVGFWERIGTDLRPRFSGDSVDLLTVAKVKGIIDPTDDFDAVNLRTLQSALPTFTNKRIVVDVTSTTYDHDISDDIAKIFTNYGATAQVEFILPDYTGLSTSDIGSWWEYQVIESQNVQVKGYASQQFIYQGILINTLESNEVGANLEIILLGDKDFYIRKIHGNWSYVTV